MEITNNKINAYDQVKHVEKNRVGGEEDQAAKEKIAVKPPTDTVTITGTGGGDDQTPPVKV